MKKYINIMMVLMFASMACEVEDKLADALTPSINTDYVGTWDLTFTGSYANADCTGDLTSSGGDGWGASINLKADGTYQTDNGTGPGEPDSGTWSSTGTTISVNFFGGALVYGYTVETTDGITTMYYNQDASGTQCTREVYTKRAS